jgi:hypothetical protein
VDGILSELQIQNGACGPGEKAVLKCQTKVARFDIEEYRFWQKKVEE